MLVLSVSDSITLLSAIENPYRNLSASTVAWLGGHTDPINIRRIVALAIVQATDLDRVLSRSAEALQLHWIVSSDVLVPVVAYRN